MLKYIRIPITKVDAKNRLVYGVAALQQEDKSGETFHYDTSVPYFKEWSKEASDAARVIGALSLGNVREMHGKSAAGKLTQLEFNDDDQQVEVCAKVVDDAAWNKVEEGVYTGFSIGGDYVRRWNEGGAKFYTARPSEISLVDNPAMPGAHFSMIKADGATEQRSFTKYAASEESNVNITNEMVIERATAMSKAAGSNSFSDFIAQARAELEKATSNPGGDSVNAVPHGGMGSAIVKPSGSADIKSVSSVQNDEETTTGTMGNDPALGHDEGVKKPSEPGNTGDASLRGGTNAPAHPEMGKSANTDPRNEVQQGWRAKDGSFHITKAAAISHNAKLDSPANALEKALANLSSSLGKDTGAVADAPTAEKPAETEKAAEGDKPYGDVKYADPGYKADKKKRYPVDTEKHIRAAWSYIHMPKNHKGYTAQQVDSIKSKIKSAWKEVIGDEPPAAAEKTIIVGTLQKGMYTVSRLACLIEELGWLQESCENEAEWEKDNSPIPAQLKGDIASLVGTLKNMLDEEAREMFDDEEMADFAEMLEMAATGMPGSKLSKVIQYIGGSALAKYAGASKAISILKAAMPKEHMGKLQEMHDHCCAMGAKCDTGSMGKGIGLVADDGTNRLAKGMEILAAENEELRSALEKAVGAINSMAADIKAIKDQPMVQQPSRLNVVEKGVDVNGATSSNQIASDLAKNFSPDLLATAAVRLIHGAGGQQLFKRS